MMRSSYILMTRKNPGRAAMLKKAKCHDSTNIRHHYSVRIFNKKSDARQSSLSSLFSSSIAMRKNQGANLLQRKVCLPKRNMTTKNFNRSPKKQQNENVMQAKADRAKQLHEELQEFMMKRNDRIQQEQEKSFLKRISEGFSNHRGEFINIAATFFCVVLAIQLANARKSLERSRTQLKEAQETIDEKTKLLQSLLDPNFSHRVAQDMMGVTKTTTATTTSPTSWWSFRNPPPKQKENDDGLQNYHDDNDNMARVLQQALSRHIGDGRLDEVERQQAVMQRLQTAQQELIMEQEQQQQKIDSDQDNLNNLVKAALENKKGDETVIPQRRPFSI